MAFADKLLVTIIGGLILWAAKGLFGYEIKRRRLHTALLSEISFLVFSVKETRRFVEGAFSNTLKEGKEVEYSADYTPEEPEIYRVYAPTLTTYLSGQNLDRTVKFYRAAKEFEILCTGFFRDLSEWKKQKHKLTSDDLNYINRKKARILHIAAIITNQEIKKISDLPTDYRGQLTPGTIVRS